MLKKKTIEPLRVECGSLDASQVGKTVKLHGWVNRRRNLGQLIFIDLRDRSGLVQVVFDPAYLKEIHEKAGDLSHEDVLYVLGEVKNRGEANINPDMATGEIEIAAQEMKILNK
jgi:aspartyl-tRNA synthetase